MTGQPSTQDEAWRLVGPLLAQLRRDEWFHAELAYCVPQGIPHSVFCGREGGQAWSTYDRACALAWQQHKASLCPGCGVSRDDQRRHVAFSEFCEHCASKERLDSSDRKPGRHIYLRRLTPQEEAIEGAP